MLISEQYLSQQKELHKNKSYGTSGWKYAVFVRALGYSDILDYGCGKRLLEGSLGFKIHNYDPAIEGLENNNQPHDLVFCGDVLEHIEPELLDDVLKDIQRCAIKKAVLIPSIVPAKKTLSDGRNAHLIIESFDWWKDRISKHFKIEDSKELGTEVLFVCAPIRS